MVLRLILQRKIVFIYSYLFSEREDFIIGHKIKKSQEKTTILKKIRPNDPIRNGNEAIEIKLLTIFK